jgi:RND family efflux transporter MFP subunit
MKAVINGIKIFAGLFLLVSLIHVACKQTGDIKDNLAISATAVKVTRAKKYEVAFPVRSSGILSSKKEMKLSFKTGGIIEKIFVDEGQYVRKGQVLATLNLSEIEAQVDLAELGVEKAERDLKRAENLYRDSVATLEQYQNAQTALNYSKSQLQVAQFNRDYSMIKAPADGKILKRLAEGNEMIAPGHPLFLFGATESDWVLRIALADVSLIRIEAGDYAAIEFDAFPGKEFTAEVTEIATSSDPYTGTYEVELSIIHPESDFVTGLIGTARIIPKHRDNYLGLPVRAVHEAEAEKAYIFIARDTTYFKQAIRIAAITDSLIYFTAELDPASEIIVDGAEYLKTNKGIHIIE